MEAIIPPKVKQYTHNWITLAAFKLWLCISSYLSLPRSHEKWESRAPCRKCLETKQERLGPGYKGVSVPYSVDEKVIDLRKRWKYVI